MAKILLAEDEVNIASFIERGLKEFGHSVTVCHNGNTGWTARGSVIRHRSLC